MLATPLYPLFKPLKLQWKDLQPHLKKQLSHFGLNPNEWKLVQKPRIQDLSHLEIELTNLSDHNYQLKGIAQVRILNNKEKSTIAFWQSISSDLSL